jgi:DNA invertase Pin-like site-specific DNA recombinase
MGVNEVMNSEVVGIYVRVSTNDQLKESGSVQFQIEKGIEYCENNLLEYRIYDEGVGSSLKGREDRVELDNLFRDIEKGKLGYVWCYRRDRLFREPRTAFYFKELIRDSNVKLIVGTNIMDLSELGNEILYDLEQAILRDHTGNLKKQAAASLWEKWEKGGFVFGRPSYGLMWDKVEGRLRLKEEEVEKLKVLFSIVRDGEYNISNICRILEMKDRKMTRSLVNKLFLNKSVYEWLYSGKVVRTIKNKNGDKHTNQFDVGGVVMSRLDFDEVFKVMTSKHRANVNYSSKSDIDKKYYGYGMYRCKCCERKLYAIPKNGIHKLWCRNSTTNKGNNRREENRLLLRGIVNCDQKGYFDLNKIEKFLWYSITRTISKSKNYELGVMSGTDTSTLDEISRLGENIKKNMKYIKDNENKLDIYNKEFKNPDSEMDYSVLKKLRVRLYDDLAMLEKKVKDDEDLLDRLKRDIDNKSVEDVIDSLVNLDIKDYTTISKKKKFMMKYVDSVELEWDNVVGRILMKIIFKQPLLDYRYLKKGESLVRLDGRIDRDKLITKYHSFKKNWEMGLN